MSDLPQKVYVEHTRQELRRMQHWFEGFEAAGGKLPPSMAAFNCLHKAIRLFEHIKTAPEFKPRSAKALGRTPNEIGEEG